jgi:hypothetical protein
VEEFVVDFVGEHRVKELVCVSPPLLLQCRIASPASVDLSP